MPTTPPNRFLVHAGMILAPARIAQRLERLVDMQAANERLTGMASDDPDFEEWCRAVKEAAAADRANGRELRRQFRDEAAALTREVGRHTMTTKEAAKVIGVRDRQVTNLARFGGLPHHRIGKPYLFDPSEVELYAQVRNGGKADDIAA